jgi:hypothetical protein
VSAHDRGGKSTTARFGTVFAVIIVNRVLNGLIIMITCLDDYRCLAGVIGTVE